MSDPTKPSFPNGEIPPAYLYGVTVIIDDESGDQTINWPHPLTRPLTSEELAQLSVGPPLKPTNLQLPSSPE